MLVTKLKTGPTLAMTGGYVFIVNSVLKDGDNFIPETHNILAYTIIYTSPHVILYCPTPTFSTA